MSGATEKSQIKLLQKLKSSIKKKDNAFVLDQLSNDPSLARASSDPELGEYLLHVAAEKGNREVLEVLLANGCPVDVPFTDEGNATALEIAADHGHLEACEALLGAGANINGQPDGVLSPLIAAIIANRKAVVTWLIEKGANLNRLHAWANQTALDHALGWEHEAIVELLKQAGAVSIQDSDEPSDSAEGTVETFIHNTIGWVPTQAVVPQPRLGNVGLKLSLVEAKNNQKVLFTSGLAHIGPRIELLMCLDARWPLPSEGIPPEHPAAFPVELLQRLALLRQQGALFSEGQVFLRTDPGLSDLIWPEAAEAMVLVDKCWANEPGQDAGDPDVVQLLSLCPAKVPKRGLDSEAFCIKKRAASWKSVALAYEPKTA